MSVDCGTNANMTDSERKLFGILFFAVINLHVVSPGGIKLE